MTTLELYNKHQAGEVSCEKFLYEVRRDNNLPWITNLTSYNDAIKILKNKGVITENIFNTPQMGGVTTSKGTAGYVDNPDKKTGDYDPKARAASLAKLRNFGPKKEEELNEDWGSSDQAIFNKVIHDELGQPKEIPMPFDPKFESAVESAVDHYWDEWDEYATDRDGLIDHAKKAYYRAYFPDKFAAFQQMFSENLNEAKKETKTLDTVNPYEYRHGLAYELDQLDDYSGEGLEKAIAKVLKNLTKDANFYSNLLNQKQSSFEFKKTETDAKGMQANADGTLKKGAGKLEKTNVKDTLSKKEAGKSKPKGVKVMPDKGVEGTQKTIKEGLGGKKETSNIQKLIDAGYSESDAEDFADEFEQGSVKVPQKVKDILTSKKDKHSKLKELLKNKLKETLSATDIQNAKLTGKPINVSKTNTQDIKALQTAKANFTTYE